MYTMVHKTFIYYIIHQTNLFQRSYFGFPLVLIVSLKVRSQRRNSRDWGLCGISFCVIHSTNYITSKTIIMHFMKICISEDTSEIESVQDFLIKLDIKPPMHLLEISTFSLNNVIVRLTKIMNRADKNWTHF